MIALRRPPRIPEARSPSNVEITTKTNQRQRQSQPQLLQLRRPPLLLLHCKSDQAASFCSSGWMIGEQMHTRKYKIAHWSWLRCPHFSKHATSESQIHQNYMQPPRKAGKHTINDTSSLHALIPLSFRFLANFKNSIRMVVGSCSERLLAGQYSPTVARSCTAPVYWRSYRNRTWIRNQIRQTALERSVCAFEKASIKEGTGATKSSCLHCLDCQLLASTPYICC